MKRHFGVVLVIFGGVVAGCASRLERGDTAAERIRSDVDLCFLLADDRGGTAVPIGPHTVITCWHNFVNADGIQSSLVEFRSGTVPAVTIPVNILERGSCSPLDLPFPAGLVEDWAVRRVPEHIPLRPVRVDSSRPLKPGDVIYLAGYFGGNDGAITREQAERLTVTVIPARVTSTPLSWSDKPDELICIRASNPDVYHGISGGAALVWDAEHDEFVLVGVYRGMWRNQFLGLGEAVHVARRVPPQWCAESVGRLRKSERRK